MSRGPSPLVLVVPRGGAGLRLDRFVASYWPHAEAPQAPSRAELQRWIEGGAVTVDGLPRKPADKVREGACVTVVPAPPPTTSAIPEKDVAFEVVYEDEAVVVVNKPAGLVVHPAKGHASGTLVNGLLGRGWFDAPREAGGTVDDEADPTRPGIVHRLDKGTSGLLVVARTPHAREVLKAQFAEHSIDREYLAICVGEARSETHSTLHGRHPRDRLKFSSKVRDGKRAVTHVTLRETFGGGLAALVGCRLETGRTHQIRVHLSDTGTPILGDALYGRPPREPRLRGIAETVGRPLLHARELGFVHPETGRRVRFEAEPPMDFREALATLRALA